MGKLQAANVCVSIGDKRILEDISLGISDGKITSIIGPNGSGKSTFLKTIAKNLLPTSGSVYFNDQDIRTIDRMELARRMAVLYQSARAPSDVTVKDLIEYGRYPHRNWWKGQTDQDQDVVSWAARQTGLLEYMERPVTTLSGGEQQRAWIAMALAQQPQTLILDEPTTYLDIAHQLEIMELIKRLNKENGLSVIMVLHDLNQAAKYSDTIIVLYKGKVAAAGSPAEVITADMLRKVFEVEVELWYDNDKKPVCITKGLVSKKEG
jgi:iron complex transport system ATP-binding protein